VAARVQVPLGAPSFCWVRLDREVVRSHNREELEFKSAGVWVGAPVDPLSALGVPKAKRRVSKKTGIPMSRGGRRMKLGKWLGMKKRNHAEIRRSLVG